MTNQSAVERIIQESMKRHRTTHDPALSGVVAATVLHICGELTDPEYEELKSRILLRKLTPTTSDASSKEKANPQAAEAKDADSTPSPRRKVRKRANG